MNRESPLRGTPRIYLTAEWIAGQVTDAFPWDEAPSHLMRDRDGAFGPADTRRIEILASNSPSLLGSLKPIN